MRNKNITVIVATDRRGAIGRDGGLLYRISPDLRRFKALTTGHAILMGRKTFGSLPKGALPMRRNIVVTRNPGFSAPSVETASSIEGALSLLEPDEKLFVIGGGEIYRQTLPLASRIELTLVDDEALNPDTFFPEIDFSEWTEIAREDFPADAEQPPFSFITLERK